MQRRSVARPFGWSSENLNQLETPIHPLTPLDNLINPAPAHSLLGGLSSNEPAPFLTQDSIHTPQWGSASKRYEIQRAGTGSFVGVYIVAEDGTRRPVQTFEEDEYGTLTQVARPRDLHVSDALWRDLERTQLFEHFGGHGTLRNPTLGERFDGYIFDAEYRLGLHRDPLYENAVKPFAQGVGDGASGLYDLVFHPLATSSPLIFGYWLDGRAILVGGLI